VNRASTIAEAAGRRFPSRVCARWGAVSRRWTIGAGTAQTQLVTGAGAEAAIASARSSSAQTEMRE